MGKDNDEQFSDSLDVDLIESWLVVDDERLKALDEDDLEDDEEEQVEAILELFGQIRRRSAEPHSASPRPSRRRRMIVTGLVAILVVLGSILALGLAGVALSPWIEDGFSETSCALLIGQAYRRALLYASISISAGLVGLGLLFAAPVLAGYLRGPRLRLVGVAAPLLALSIVSGCKERVLRENLEEARSLDPGRDATLGECRRVFAQARILGW